MSALSPAEQEEARAIGQAICHLCAGSRVPVGFHAQLNALATSIAGIFETRAEAEAFIDNAVIDLKANVTRWHGTIETLGPTPTKKHSS